MFWGLDECCWGNSSLLSGWFRCAISYFSYKRIRMFRWNCDVCIFIVRKIHHLHLILKMCFFHSVYFCWIWQKVQKKKFQEWKKINFISSSTGNFIMLNLENSLRDTLILVCSYSDLTVASWQVDFWMWEELRTKMRDLRVMHVYWCSCWPTVALSGCSLFSSLKFDFDLPVARSCFPFF